MIRFQQRDILLIGSLIVFSSLILMMIIKKRPKCQSLFSDPGGNTGTPACHNPRVDIGVGWETTAPVGIHIHRHSSKKAIGFS